MIFYFIGYAIFLDDRSRRIRVASFVPHAIVLLACWLGYGIGMWAGAIKDDPLGLNGQLYRQLSALIAAVCLVTFHTFGMYSPTKSLLNMQEFKAVAKSTVVAFLVFLTLIVYLHSTRQDPVGPIYGPLVTLHDAIDLKINPNDMSRLTLLATFGLILVLMTASRFVSFKAIQLLHRRGIGNRNVLVYGAGETGRKLQRKFELVPTLGLNLIGFVDDEPRNRDVTIGRTKVMGSFEDLERLVGVHKVSEVFVAMPEESEEKVMRVMAECERLGVTYRVVPRFYHLLASTDSRPTPPITAWS